MSPIIAESTSLLTHDYNALALRCVTAAAQHNVRRVVAHRQLQPALIDGQIKEKPVLPWIGMIGGNDNGRMIAIAFDPGDVRSPHHLCGYFYLHAPVAHGTATFQTIGP